MYLVTLDRIFRLVTIVFSGTGWFGAVIVSEC